MAAKKSKLGSRKEKFAVFDAKQYINDLSQEMKKVVYDLQELMWKEARGYLKGTDFRDNPVELLKGTTSDAERKGAVIESLVQHRVRHIVGKSIKATVSALRTNFEDTHIGLYYEYGTGTKTDPRATYESLGTPNAFFRPPNTQSPIVTRSKKYDYGYGPGVYMDAGGNLRKTNAPVGGKRTASFTAYIGEDIEAVHWFENAFKELEKVFMERYKKALGSVHPGAYIKLAGAKYPGQRGRYVIG